MKDAWHLCRAWLKSTKAFKKKTVKRILQRHKDTHRSAADVLESRRKTVAVAGSRVLRISILNTVLKRYMWILKHL